MKNTIFAVVTIIFVVVFAAFMILHFQTSVDPVTVDAAVTASFNPTLDTSFVDELKVRSETLPIQDLDY